MMLSSLVSIVYLLSRPSRSICLRDFGSMLFPALGSSHPASTFDFATGRGAMCLAIAPGAILVHIVLGFVYLGFYPRLFLQHLFLSHLFVLFASLYSLCSYVEDSISFPGTNQLRFWIFRTCCCMMGMFVNMVLSSCVSLLLFVACRRGPTRIVSPVVLVLVVFVS